MVLGGKEEIVVGVVVFVGSDGVCVFILWLVWYVMYVGDLEEGEFMIGIMFLEEVEGLDEEVVLDEVFGCLVGILGVYF